MARTYKNLDASAKKAIESEIAKRDQPTAPVVDDAMVAAWERDHYAHSLLLAKAKNEDEKKTHADAMKTIEDALTAAGR